jgi:ribosomal protein S18 acetylase RimI-like enzyme
LERMAESYIIRRAEINDAAGVKKIEVLCNLSNWSRKDYEAECLRPDALFFVSEMNGRIVGFLLARLITVQQNLIEEFEGKNRKNVGATDQNSLEISKFEIDADRKLEINVNWKKEMSDTDSKQEESAVLEIEIYNFGVNPGLQRSGIGSALIGRLFEECSAGGKKAVIRLDVRASNTSAIEFYKAHGFEFAGVRKNFYTSPVEDAFLMRRGFDPERT